MSKILKSVCFVVLILLSVPAFANKVYSGISTTSVPHPTIPNRWCEVTISWTITLDDNGNCIGTTTSVSNACGSGMTIHQTLDATMAGTDVLSLAVISCQAEGSGDGNFYCNQYNTPGFLGNLAADMNNTIKSE